MAMGAEYDSEDSFIDRIKHIKIVAAMRCDMGLLSFYKEAESLAVNEGKTATFTVDGVNGSTFRWYKDGSALSNTGNVSGATTETLTISNTSLDDEGVYYCRMDDLNSRPVHLYTDRQTADWAFEGTIKDTISGYQASIVGSPSLAEGVTGNALSLDGNGDALKLQKGLSILISSLLLHGFTGTAAATGREFSTSVQVPASICTLPRNLQVIHSDLAQKTPIILTLKQAMLKPQL